jgi:uncharacterized protein YhaN
LQHLIDQLEKEAADLFKPSGQNPWINQAIKRFKDLQKQAREKSLSYRDWEKHKDALADAQKKHADLERQRDYVNSELHRLNRLHQAIPELASLKSWQEQKQNLGSVIPLTPDFEKQVDRVNQAMQEAEEQLQKNRNRKKILAEKLGAIQLNAALLHQEEQVNDFHQRLGEFRKGQKDLPVRNGMRISLRREAAQFLQQVRPDLSLESIQTLAPVLMKKRTIQTLSARYEAINQQLVSAKKQVQTAGKECTDLETALAQMPEPKDPSPLVQAVKLAQKAGDIDGQLEKARQKFVVQKKECTDALQRIGLWSGDLDELMQIPLPLFETVQQFEHRFDRITREHREIKKSRKAAETDLQTVHNDIRKLVSTGEVPSEKELARTREKRDHGWHLLRRQWIDQKDVARESTAYDPDQPLPDSYQQYVGKADMIADRLWREADRVASAAALEAKKQGLQKALADIDKEEQSFLKQSSILDAQWMRVWQPVGVTPLSPKEMGGWLTQMDKLRFTVGDLFAKERQINLDTARQQDLVQKVKKALVLMGEESSIGESDLDPVLVFARTVIEAITSRRQEVEALLARKQNAQKVLHQAQENRILYDKIQEELEQLDQEMTEAQKKQTSANDRMDALLLTARCEKPEDLAATITRFALYQRLEQKISDTKAVLAKIGAGVDHDTLAQQAAAVNADELPGRIAALQTELADRIYPAINTISQEIGEEKARLAAMDGNADAAETAEKMEQELAKIGRLSDRYTVSKLAARVLQQEIERYRESHQDPVLKIASRYFHDLTQGSFAGLRTDVNDNAEPILVGVRPDNLRLTVDKMSAGTRDQLFLALRLATLEWGLKKAVTWPRHRNPCPLLWMIF